MTTDRCRVQLYLVADAVRGVPAKDAVTRPQRASSEDVWWFERRWEGPVARLAVQAGERGKPLGRFSFTSDSLDFTFGAGLSIGSAGTVTLATPGCDVASACRWLWQAPLQNGFVEPARGRERKKTSSPSKRMAMLRQASKAVEQGHKVGQVPECAPEVEAAIAAYTPMNIDMEDWQRIEGATRVAMRAYSPPSPQWVSGRGGMVANYAWWLVTVTGREVLTPQDLTDVRRVDVYVSQVLQASPTFRTATRSALRRVAGKLSALGEPETISRSRALAPYEPADVSRLMLAARAQPTLRLRRTMGFLVGLSVGAGLASRDFYDLRRDDLIGIQIEGRPAWFVQVRGKNPRNVIVRAEQTQLINEALQWHTEAGKTGEDLLVGTAQGKSTEISQVVPHFRVAGGEKIDMDMRRLRASWLVAMMHAPIPLAVLLKVAGLRSSSALARLMDFCPPLEVTPDCCYPPPDEGGPSACCGSAGVVGGGV